MVIFYELYTVSHALKHYKLYQKNCIDVVLVILGFDFFPFFLNTVYGSCRSRFFNSKLAAPSSKQIFLVFYPGAGYTKENYKRNSFQGGYHSVIRLLELSIFTVLLKS